MLHSSHMSHSDTNKLDAIFEPDKWIGKGINYLNAPIHVILARETQEKVPAGFQTFYPLSSLLIESFLQFPLPRSSFALSSYSSEKWFSQKPPAIHSHVNLVEVRTGLKKAREATERLIAEDAAVKAKFPTINSIFCDTKWNETFNHGGVEVPAHEFVPLLREVMLGKGITQGMIAHLQDRLCQDPIASMQHYICGTEFSNFIATAEERGRIVASTKNPGKMKAWCLQDIGEVVERNPALQGWIPVLREQHQVVIKVDFESKSIGYGDTLPNFSAPKAIADSLQRWIKLQFSKNFKWVRKKMVAHGIQRDTFSCIPGLANMIARAIWGDELWSMDKRMLDRVQWYVNLTPSDLPPSNDDAMNVDEPSSVLQTRTRPDINNLIHPQSNVEQITSEDLFDMVMMVGEVEIEAGVNVQDENQVVEGKEGEAREKIGPAATTEPVASSSKAAGTLNAAWGGFMKHAGAGSSSKSDANLKGKKKRDRSPSLGTSKKKIKGDSVCGPTGYSTAALAERKYKEDLDAGKFNTEKMAVFKKVCLAVDAHAEFNAEWLRAVRCSNCATETVCAAQSGAPNPYRFIEHHRKCINGDIRIAKAQKATAKTRTLTSGAFKGFRKLSTKVLHFLTKSLSTLDTVLKHFPCPGITEADNLKVTVYLRRSSALGGGSRSVVRIAKDLFGSSFKGLSKEQKNQVIDQQDSKHTWRNNHQRMNCRSTSCLQAALNHKALSPKGLKHVSGRFQNRLLAHQWVEAKGLKELVESALIRSKEEGSIYTRFAQGAVSGKYDNYGVFLGLLHAMVQKQDKHERGVGMQNFQYCPNWDQFMHIASIHSPRTHEFIREHFPGRTKCSFQFHESKAPKLSMEIGEETFMAVYNHLQARGYIGPINIACNDSKLLSGLRLYYDPKEMKHFLVGGTEGPIHVPNSDDIEAVMKNPVVKKGSKVRLWTGTIPLPDMPPFVIAAIPILDSMSIPDLLEIHKLIMFGLLDHGVKIISYACDGTENERGVQEVFMNLGESVIEETIPNPQSVFRGQPIIMIQDSKHSLKNFCNNLFSGARLLVLDKHPEMLGLIIYLFVFMEIPNAYQNRHITHEERLNILLQARYFIDMWTAHIDRCPGYLQKQYCISRESLDIVSYLVNGYISLLMVRIREKFLLKSFNERSSDMKARAAGYHHTYFDTKGLDIAALSYFPTREDFERIKYRSSSEAVSLIAALGISPSELYSSPLILPSLATWAPPPDIEYDSDSEESLDDGFVNDDGSLVGSVEELQVLIQATQHQKALDEQTPEERAAYENLSRAALLLTVDEQTKINSLKDVDEEVTDECVAEDMHCIKDFRKAIRQFPPLEIDASTHISFLPSSQSQDRIILLQNLITLREQHQTEHASKAVRVRGIHAAYPAETNNISLRKTMVETFHRTNRLSQDRGVTTTGDRLKRWVTEATGNSLNAQVTAAGNAKEAMAKRRKSMLDAGIKPLEVPADAGVSKKVPISLHSWGFVLARTQKDNLHVYKLFLGKVEAMYSKGGGKNGKHAAVTEAENIAALSYIGLQLFKYGHGTTFTASTSQTRPFQTLTYAFIPSICFLSMTHALPQSMVDSVSGQKDLTEYVRNHGRRKPPGKGGKASLAVPLAPIQTEDCEDVDDLGF
ncbi:hypothetical protein BT96DRAFT_951391 [Gymnopus androsaceus JB14]|uniref:Uncharacterized protein n=1 Tax=Gymnopus androsaceus JB14 TaxID=1447944 RepID=A0A6A4GCZ0_9AGAR|nr:hypothetical protein BT96DRAFT_951391 [Gymnopus androsaceus JB14]